MSWYWWYLVIGLGFAFLCGLSPKWDKESEGTQVGVALMAVIVWPLLIPVLLAEIAAMIRGLFK